MSVRMAALALAASGCVSEGPPAREEPSAPASADPARITAPFFDDFERAELGEDYLALSPGWRIEAGRLCGQGARNQGVWLRRKLPANARIEVEATAGSDEGDLKIELWGDGRSGATGVSYSDATSYVAIYGGWKNSQHVLARLDEHGADRLALPVVAGSEDERARPVTPGRSYRFRFERRQGNILSWAVDGSPLFELVDEEPLSGPGHEHLAFNDWTAPVCFDNLRIVPLPD